MDKKKKFIKKVEVKKLSVKSTPATKPKLKTKVIASKAGKAKRGKVNTESPALITNKVTFKHNCLNCYLFVGCGNLNKAYNFICNQYTPRVSEVDNSASLSITNFNEIFQPSKSSTKINKSESTEEKVKSTKKIKSHKNIIKYSKNHDDSDIGGEEDGDENADEETKKEFSILKVIKDLENSLKNGNNFIDLKYDDRDLKEAKNFLEFTTSPNYLDFTPFAKQIQIGSNFFGDICWNKKCTDVHYAKNIPVDATVESLDDVLERITFLEYGRCPKCKSTRYDFWKSGEQKDYNELIGICGQRASKSTTVAIMSAYLVHKFLKLQNPAKALKLLNNQVLHGMFVATTFVQAKDAVFDPFRELIDNSKWYNDYCKLLDYYSKKFGEEDLYKIKDTFVQFKTRGLILYPKGPNKRTLRGRTSFLCSIDEISWYSERLKGESTAVKLNADEIYGALKRSLLTVRSAVARQHTNGNFNLPGPMFANISSPYSIYDKGWQLLQAAKTSKTTYSIHASTFEINPNIKEEDMEDEKNANLITYRRDYLAIPPKGSNAFISSNKILISCINKKLKNAVTIKQQSELSNSGTKITTGYAKIVRKSSVSSKVLAIDAGYTFNSFSGAVLSMNEENVVIEALFEIVPGPNKPLNYTNIYNEVLVPIVEDMNVRYICADRWNSLKILQDLEAEYNIGWGQYRLTYADFINFKQALIDTDIILPVNEIKIKDAIKLSTNNYPHCFLHKPIAHFCIQALTVEDLVGKTIIKGESKTDDLWRAAVLGYSRIMNDEVRANWLDGEIETSKRRLNTNELIAFGSYGGAGSGGKPANSRGSSVISMGSLSSGGSGKKYFA